MTIIKETGEGLSVDVVVKPCAGKNEVVSFESDVLKVKIKVAAHDGAANKELINFLADFFDIAKSRVVLLRGTHSRQKKYFLHPLPNNNFFNFCHRHYDARIIANLRKFAIVCPLCYTKKSLGKKRKNMRFFWKRKARNRARTLRTS